MASGRYVEFEEPIPLPKGNPLAALCDEKKHMPDAYKGANYSQKDLRNVSDNPELTKADFARAKPFAQVFPGLAASIRKGRGAGNQTRREKPKPARGR